MLPTHKNNDSWDVVVMEAVNSFLVEADVQEMQLLQKPNKN